jgi:hypothetical protein
MVRWSAPPNLLFDYYRLACNRQKIINFSASSVPILQLGLSGKGLAEQQLNDLALNFCSDSADHRPGCSSASSLWRKTASGHDKHGPQPDAGQERFSH